jgi:hypothetical protein
MSIFDGPDAITVGELATVLAKSIISPGAKEIVIYPKKRRKKDGK